MVDPLDEGTIDLEAYLSSIPIETDPEELFDEEEEEEEDEECHELKGCRYIHGDPQKKWRYCQEPVSNIMRSYCDKHYKLCHIGVYPEFHYKLPRPSQFHIPESEANSFQMSVL